MRATGGLRTFSGAVAIITGAASGIGRALAEELAIRGCDGVLADLQIQLAQKVASEICTSSGRATAVEADVTNFAALEQVVHQTVQRTGRPDYMFNNAGINIDGRTLIELSEEQLHATHFCQDGILSDVSLAMVRGRGLVSKYKYSVEN
jgi:NAD(P)-dependent dehydrogenase (short-subunit alcohol dehydrogenase family)